MHPTAHMSTAAPYFLQPKRSSGARYHRLYTWVRSAAAARGDARDIVRVELSDEKQSACMNGIHIEPLVQSWFTLFYKATGARRCVHANSNDDEEESSCTVESIAITAATTQKNPPLSSVPAWCIARWERATYVTRDGCPYQAGRDSGQERGNKMQTASIQLRHLIS